MVENFWDMHMGDDEHAATYMLTYNEGPGFELRHRLGALINPGESILDVGCGPGWNLEHFLEFGPEFKAYMGLDYSSRFIRVANARTHTEEWRNKYHDLLKGMFGFAVSDARKLNYYGKQIPNSSYDVVIIQDCLEHTNGFEKPIYEALRVAKRRVIITFWHLEDSDTPHINDDGNDGWGAWYDKREWEKFLDTLNLHWLHDRAQIGNRNRDIYVIDKMENHGDLPTAQERSDSRGNTNETN